MTSASQLYADIIGEDDYDDYDDYSEDDEWDADPQKPSLPVEKVEKPRPVIPTFFCEVCDAHVPQSEAQTHEASKRHRGLVFDQRVIANQQRANELARKKAEENSRYFAQAFSPAIREKVLSYLPAVELLRMRLVCSEWNEYLTKPETWLEQSYLRDGVRLESLENCYISEGFPLMNLAFCRVLCTEKSATQFLDDVAAGRVWGIWKIKVDLAQIPKLLHQNVAEAIGNCSGHTLHVKVEWPGNRGDLAPGKKGANLGHIQVLEGVMAAFNRALFGALVDNRAVEEFYARYNCILNSGVNPLAALANNKKMRLMDISVDWLPIIADQYDTEVQKEAMKKANSYLFHHTHCTALTISRGENGAQLPRRHTKFLMAALEDNTILEKLVLSNVGMRTKSMPYVARFLMANSTLKELDISQNCNCFDLAALENNTSLEVLDISGISLSESLQKAHRRFKKNTSLLRLNMGDCFVRLSPQTELFSLLPSSLTHLLAPRVISFHSPFSANSFDDVRNLLPHLQELDIAGSSFTTFQGVNTLLSTTSLKSLAVFKGIKFPQEEDFFDIYGFQQNSTLVSCDHHETEDRRMTEMTLNELDHYLQRNSLARRGRRTKAAR